MRQILAWSCLAIVGLALTVGVTVTASKLSGQTIGPASEPLEASQALAPRPTTTAPTSTKSRPKTKRRSKRSQQARTSPTQLTAPATPSPQPSPSPPANPAATSPVVPQASRSDDASDDSERESPDDD